MRIAMGHMTAESAYPGTMDEKLRCEAATYIYVQENCPEIPTPHLFGFGFSDGIKFTHSKHLPFLRRFIRQIKRLFCHVLQLPAPSQYIRHPNSHSPGFAYSVLEYIERTTGSMLSRSWNYDRLDSIKRENFLRDHARIGLSLARKPVPRIGSFRFLDDGTISLSNRPLISSILIMEKEGANRVIGRDETYNTVEPFISDLLTCQEDRFLRKPNAVLDKRDCLMQMTALSLLRATTHHFMEPDSRYGPFHLCLTDDHQDQYVVDTNCHITHIIDLEFVCSLPMVMFTAPYWLTGYGVDQLYGQRLEEFNELRQQYMRVLKEEEGKLGLTVSIAQPTMLNWNRGSCWFAYCLTSIDAAFNIFEKNIRPLYHRSSIPDDADEIVSHFFVQSSQDLIRGKIADKDD